MASAMIRSSGWTAPAAYSASNRAAPSASPAFAAARWWNSSMMALLPSRVPARSHSGCAAPSSQPARSQRPASAASQASASSAKAPPT